MAIDFQNNINLSFAPDFTSKNIRDMTSSNMLDDTTARPPASDNGMAPLEQSLELASESETTDILMGNGDEGHSEDTDATEPTSITGISTARFGKQVSEVVWEEMMAEYPWIETEQITKIASQCATLIKGAITEQ